MPPPGIEPATPCFPAYRSNHSAIGTVNDMLLKLKHSFFTLLSINTCDNANMKLILVRCVRELTVRQNLHFFYQYRYYLIPVKELYKNKTNHPISSNSHPSATANIAIHCLKRGSMYEQTKPFSISWRRFILRHVSSYTTEQGVFIKAQRNSNCK